MVIEELIGEATEYDKKEKLETKRPKSWCKSVSAFANTIGGMLIFGMTEDNELVGLENAERAAETISEQIKVRINPIPDFTLRFYEAPTGKKLVIVDVSAGIETPYYYVADGSMMAYQRVGNESVPVSPMQLKQLVLKGNEKSYDSLRSQYRFEDMAFTKLKSVYKQRTGNTFEDTDYESFGIVDSAGNLSNAGALLADESPVRQSRVFCTRWNGLDKASGIVDAIDDHEYAGGLVNLLQDSLSFIFHNSSKAWMKTADSRIEMPDYPERAVTEGLVNALIHRNYLEVGSEVHVDIFDDRLEIFSPGGMCDGTKVQDRNLWKVSSKRRNPVIADVFGRLRYMDRRGSGFKKILEDYHNHPLYMEHMEPEFCSDYDEFVLTLKNVNYYSALNIQKNAEKKVPKKSAEKKVPKKTNDHFEKILTYMRSGQWYKSDEISEIIGLKDRRTRELLKILVERGDLEENGLTKGKKYKRKN